jgi:hypothetical protein
VETAAPAADRGGAGVSNDQGGTISSLSNANHATIAGGNGGAPAGCAHCLATGAGGAGIANSATVTTLTNKGTIAGGIGGTQTGTGGAGIANSGTIAALTNGGEIIGGSGFVSRGRGGAGVSNASGAAIQALSNAGGGTISGGVDPESGQGGAGVANSAAITALTNKGTISGANGGNGLGLSVLSRTGGLGGAGVSNLGVIATLTNSAKILGGNGGDTQFGKGGAGGAAISNSGTIATLTNSGTIVRGAGGAGTTPGAAGDAILSAGAHASIGSITNTGKIIGNVEIGNQASVTVTGGSGKTFGSWAGGAIRIGKGNLTFASGNTALGENISVDGGSGTVTNMGTLRLAAPQAITGSFTLTGVLGLDFAGDAFGEYGALTTTKLTTLDGGLAIDLTEGFTLAKGDSFDILGFASLAGPGFTGLSRDGEADGFVDLRRRREIGRSDQRHVAGPCRGAWRLASLVGHPRTLDLGDARGGLPRPRRPRPA